MPGGSAAEGGVSDAGGPGNPGGVANVVLAASVDAFVTGATSGVPATPAIVVRLLMGRKLGWFVECDEMPACSTTRQVDVQVGLDVGTHARQ